MLNHMTCTIPCFFKAMSKPEMTLLVGMAWLRLLVNRNHLYHCTSKKKKQKNFTIAKANEQFD